MNFLNFTFFKNMTTRIKNSYYCLKLRKKALVLFLLFGTCLTIPLAAISSIFLMHYLTSEEQKNLKQTRRNPYLRLNLIYHSTQHSLTIALMILSLLLF